MLSRTPGRDVRLPIAHVIVSRHGGHFAVRSPSPGSTTVSIYLPAAPDGVKSTTDEPAVPSLTGCRLLLLTDDAATRGEMTKMLHGFGPEIDLAANGREALSLHARVLQTVLARHSG